MFLTSALFACTELPVEGKSKPDDDSDPVLHTGGDSTASTVHTGGHTGHSGDSAHTALDTIDCSYIPPGPRPWIDTTAITTEEDFDFDATGLLLAQNFYSIKGTDRAGAVQVIASGLNGDMAGIRSTPTGDIVYASPDDGRYVAVNRMTGGAATIMSGLTTPNSLEMGTDGVFFGAEFTRNGRIVWFDTTNQTQGTIGVLDYPNGLGLSMDEQTLYIMTTSGYWSGTSTLWAADRGKGNDFSALRHVADLPTMSTSVTVDKCGTLYLIGYNDGRVFRFSEATGVFEELADLGSAGFSAIRFSPGIGGFLPTNLYATNRSRVYEIEIGVEGRHVLNP